MGRKNTSLPGAFMKRCGQYAVYLAVRGLETVLWLLPLSVVALVGRGIGLLGWLVAPKYRRLAYDNLRIAFGREKSEAERRKIARDHFASLGGNFLCGLKLPLMSEAEIVKRVTLSGLEHSDKLEREGKPLLYAVCHLSCWELLTQVPSLFVPKGMKPASIFQALGNPFLNAHVQRKREHLGYTLFDRKDGFAGPLKHLRSGEVKGVLGVLVDQHAGDGGVWCPFFDRLASTTPLPALMAIRCGTPLLPITVQNAGLARWRMTIHPPVDSGEAKPTAQGITAALNLVVEGIIREAPENWFWVHNRWKTPKPDFLLAQYKRGITFPQGYDMSRLQKFEVVLRSPNWLGDACMTFPAVRAIRQGRPDLRLSVFTPAKLADLWSSLGLIDEVISKEKDDGLWASAGRIKKTGRYYDAGILFTNSSRSTFEFWLAGVNRLCGYQGSMRSWLLGQITPELKKTGKKPEHHARRYLRIAGVSAPELFAPDRAEVVSESVVGICAGAEYGQAKRWPAERFVETIKLVSERLPGVRWELYGAPAEKELGEKLATGIDAPCKNLVGKTTLTELIAHLRQCRLLITNDTGTMHLAAALGVPTVSIFGSTEPVATGPLGDHHTVIRHKLECSPCFERECPLGHYECMTRIQPKEVADAAVRMLKEYAGVEPTLA
jgi:heptosyltransferase II